MQIKKYTAPSLKEASLKMKSELGEDAIILGSRIVENENKIGRKKMYEISAGFDKPTNAKVKSNKNSSSYKEDISTLKNKIYQNQNISKSTIKPQLKNTINQASADSDLKKEIKDIIDTLAFKEVHKSIITVIMKQLKSYEKFLHSTNLDSYVLSIISSFIQVKNFELNKKNSPKIVSIVGPTGVGKTTCIAKLAVIAKLLNELKVGLISIDTYRLGAIDQLKIFSEISNIDFQVAYEPEEMPELINKFKDKDVIFVDTAGRSQKDIKQLEKTKEYLNKIKVDETFLVLSSTNTTRTLYDVAEKFKIFNYDSLIFTKIDEAAVFGNVLNVITNFNLPVTFLSNGQVIPDDIIAADSEFISNLVLTGKMNK